MDKSKIPVFGYIWKYRDLKKSMQRLKVHSHRPPRGLMYKHAGVQIPVLPIHMMEIYLICKMSSVMTTITVNLKNEIFRRGLIWRPLFVFRCEDCDFDMQHEEDECPKCGSRNLRKPDMSQLDLLDAMIDNCNQNNMSLIEVCKELEYDLDIIDDCYMILVKDYITDDDGKIEYQRVREIIRGDPILIRMVADKDGELGNVMYTCIEHRSFQKEKPGRCDEVGCNKKLHAVHHVAIEGGSATTAPYMRYIEGEVIHASKYHPSLLYGFPPPISLWKEISILLHMNNYVNDYYQNQRMPRGAIMVSTNNVRQTFDSWDEIMERVEQNPAFLPIIPIQQMPDGSNQGRAEMLKFMDTLAEMQYIPAKDDIRQRISALYGVTNVLMNDSSGSQGLNQEGLEIKVADRSVESGQNVWNVKMYPNLCAEFGVTDYVLNLKPNEEEDEMEELQIDQMRIQVASGMQQMGFDVELDDEGKPTKFSGEARDPQEMMGQGGMGGMGGMNDMFGGDRSTPGLPEPPNAMSDTYRSAEGIPIAHEGGLVTKEHPVYVDKDEVIIPLEKMQFSIKKEYDPARHGPLKTGKHGGTYYETEGGGKVYVDSSQAMGGRTRMGEHSSQSQQGRTLGGGGVRKLKAAEVKQAASRVINELGEEKIRALLEDNPLNIDDNVYEAIMAMGVESIGIRQDQVLERVKKELGIKDEPEIGSDASNEITAFVDSEESPWNSDKHGAYGGLPGAGGFDNFTEYQAGGAQMAEEAHCIIGSIGKAVRSLKWQPGDDSYFQMRAFSEQAHIEEEMALIEKNMKEYGQEEIYTERLNDAIKSGDTKYVEGMVKDIREQAPKLKQIASDMWDRVQGHTPTDLQWLAMASYNFIETLADKMLESVSTYEEGYVTNAYTDTELKFKARQLRVQVDAVWEKSEARDIQKYEYDPGKHGSLQTGPRGGKFFTVASGTKVYVGTVRDSTPKERWADWDIDFETARGKKVTGRLSRRSSSTQESYESDIKTANVHDALDMMPKGYKKVPLKDCPPELGQPVLKKFKRDTPKRLQEAIKWRIGGPDNFDQVSANQLKGAIRDIHRDVTLSVDYRYLRMNLGRGLGKHREFAEGIIDRIEDPDAANALAKVINENGIEIREQEQPVSFTESGKVYISKAAVNMSDSATQKYLAYGMGWIYLRNLSRKKDLSTPFVADKPYDRDGGVIDPYTYKIMAKLSERSQATEHKLTDQQRRHFSKYFVDLFALTATDRGDEWDDPQAVKGMQAMMRRGKLVQRKPEPRYKPGQHKFVEEWF